MEALKKEFLNNLIAINNLAEAIANNTEANDLLFLQLKDQTIRLNENAIVLHHLSKHESKLANELKKEDAFARQILASPEKEIREVEPPVIEAISKPVLVEEVVTYIEPIVEAQLSIEIKEVEVAPTQEQSPAPKKFKELSQFLGINDRVQIQQYLFKGDTETLQNFIKMIDSSDSSQKAIGIINGFKNQYNWDNESDAFINLISVIEQKFRS